MYTKILAFLMIALSVNAQELIVVTNTRISVSASPAFELTGPTGGYRITYVVESTDGAPIPLNSANTFRLQVWAADGVRIYNLPNSNYVETSLSAGQLRFAIDNLDAGEYRLQGIVTPPSGNTNENWNFTHHTLIVTNNQSVGGGSVNVSVTTTANVTAASSGTGNVVTGITANGSTVTEHRGTVAGGGGGYPVNGYTPTNLTFNASYPFTVSTTTNASGMTITYGLSGNAGTVIVPAGNTSTSFLYYVDTNAQFYTAGPTATQLLFWGISPAAGYSAGGLAYRFVACTGSQVYACYIPQGGLAISNGTAQGGWGYVRGGSATSTNGGYAVSGAGSLAVLTGTNVVLHLGGPGGAASSSARSNGGGLIGYSHGSTASGSGGTQTNHGAAATAAAGATAGSSTGGGNGTAAGGTSPGSGGGGGLYSGGGGCGWNSSVLNPGGAGSTDIVDPVLGYTARSAADSSSPPSTDNPLYKSPYGVGQTTGGFLTNNQRGASGFLAVVSYPSP